MAHCVCVYVCRDDWSSYGFRIFRFGPATSPLGCLRAAICRVGVPNDTTPVKEGVSAPGVSRQAGVCGSFAARVCCPLPGAEPSAMRKREVVLTFLAAIALAWAAVQWAWGTGAQPHPKGALESDSPLLFHAKARPPSKLPWVRGADPGGSAKGRARWGDSHSPGTRRDPLTGPLSHCVNHTLTRPSPLPVAHNHTVLPGWLLVRLPVPRGGRPY